MEAGIWQCREKAERGCWPRVSGAPQWDPGLPQTLTQGCLQPEGQDRWIAQSWESGAGLIIVTRSNRVELKAGNTEA
jgi:hypothetical protein